jgi:hypothetical protein
MIKITNLAGLIKACDICDERKFCQGDIEECIYGFEDDEDMYVNQEDFQKNNEEEEKNENE